MLEEREGKSFSIDEQQSRRIGPNSWIIYLFVNWIVANEGLEGNAISNRFFISPLLDSTRPWKFISPMKMLLRSSETSLDRITLYSAFQQSSRAISLLARIRVFLFPSLATILKCRSGASTFGSLVACDDGWMDPSVPRGCFESRLTARIRSFLSTNKVDRSEKGEGEEGLNRVQRSPRFSNLGVSLVFSDISLLAIGDFFLCVRGRGSRNRDRNNTSKFA